MLRTSTMARRRTTTYDQGPSLWGIYEVEPDELVDHVNYRLAAAAEPLVPAEPAWLGEAMDASWPRVLAEVDDDRS
jgi:hypothetical protein